MDNGRVAVIGPAELARLRAAGPVAVLDVREAEELAICQLDGARHMSLGQLAQRLAELEDWRGQPIHCLCHHGIRSHYAAEILAEAGHQAVNIAGGIDAWSRLVDQRLPRY
jgi:rhodanese-related sulfurtransferase